MEVKEGSRLIHGTSDFFPISTACEMHEPEPLAIRMPRNSD